MNTGNSEPITNPVSDNEGVASEPGFIEEVGDTEGLDILARLVNEPGVTDPEVVTAENSLYIINSDNRRETRQLLEDLGLSTVAQEGGRERYSGLNSEQRLALSLAYRFDTNFTDLFEQGLYDPENLSEADQRMRQLSMTLTELDSLSRQVQDGLDLSTNPRYVAIEIPVESGTRVVALEVNSPDNLDSLRSNLVLQIGVLQMLPDGKIGDKRQVDLDAVDAESVFSVVDRDGLNRLQSEKPELADDEVIGALSDETDGSQGKDDLTEEGEVSDIPIPGEDQEQILPWGATRAYLGKTDSVIQHFIEGKGPEPTDITPQAFLSAINFLHNNIRWHEERLDTHTRPNDIPRLNAGIKRLREEYRKRFGESPTSN